MKRWSAAQPRLAVIDRPPALPPRAPKGTRWRKGDKVVAKATKADAPSATETT